MSFLKTTQFKLILGFAAFSGVASAGSVSSMIPKGFEDIVPFSQCKPMGSDGFVSPKCKFVPGDSTAIIPLTAPQVKQVLAKFSKAQKTQLSSNGMIKISSDGQMSATDGENIVVYQGDFSNEGKTQYLFTALDGGSHDVDSILGVYQLEGEKLTSINFKQVISQNLYHKSNGDLSKFYNHMAIPFAYTQNSKTYLRFAHILPKKPTQICTYIWQGKRLVSLNPDVCQHPTAK